MDHEEDELARLDADKAGFDASETSRHARYEAEDAEIAARRAREDDLHAQGAKVRDDMRADLVATIEKRKLQEQAMDPENVASLMARVAHMEAMLKAAEDAKVAAPVAPAV